MCWQAKYLLDMTFTGPTSPANFYVPGTLHYALLQSINKENRGGIFKGLLA